MPSFVDVVNGANADASTIQQVVDALKGTVGKGIPLSPTAINDPINFAVSIKNNDAGASKALVVYKADGTVLLQVDKNGVIASPDGVLGASQIATLTGTQTLTNKTLTAPVLTDSNGNTALALAAAASAVNYLQVQNAATGSRPELDAAGTDTNIGIVLRAKGTGTVNIASGAGLTVTRINDVNNNQAISIAAAGSPVNYLQFQNAGTTFAPEIQTTGTDTNIGLVLRPKGTGATNFVTGDLFGPAGSQAMTSGFVYIPSAAGAPSGTPTARSGTVPLYYNTSGGAGTRLYAYSGGSWVAVA